MSVGENIRLLRENRSMSQAELARQVNVSASMITQIERGTKTPSLLLGKEIADALLCPITALLDKQNTP